MNSHLRWRRRRVAGGAAAVGLLGVAGYALSQTTALPRHPFATLTPVAVLARPIADSTPNAAQLRRGQYLVVAGDCMSCHLRKGGEPFAGGLGLNTPFGVIYSSNISADPQTGIGSWTSAQFYRAMHDGIGAHGENLYPAFPYPWFRRASREDDDAILAYLKTSRPVAYVPPQTQLHFPFSVRAVIKGWNALFLNSAEFTSDPGQSAEWNRGAYLVNGLGHCGGCHTPKNDFGADKSGQDFHGGDLDNWVAPDLTSNTRTGLGSWSIDEVSEFLLTGRNVHAGAGGAMADVITYSTSLLTDGDRHAIAVYLKSRPATVDAMPAEPDPGAMRRGAAIYSDACTACHLEDGVGQPRFFPPLGQNAMLQQPDPRGLLHIILAGSRVGTSESRPSPLTMPSFAWKLTDQEIADVATYLRHSWGNQAAAVAAADASDARKRLHLETVHLTANSGDQD